MQKFRSIALNLSLLVLFSVTTTHAISLTPVPISQSVAVSNPVSVALAILDLGNLTTPSLSTFDLNLTFDPTILAFSSAIFGDPTLGDQLDVLGLGVNPSSSSLTNPGILNLFELSLDSPDDLNSLQAGDFTLVTVFFNTIAAGISPLTLIVNTLGDANGNPLTTTLGTGSITVTGQPPTPIPEPSTMVLLSTGLLSLFTYTWRHRRSAPLRNESQNQSSLDRGGEGNPLDSVPSRVLA